MKRSEWMPALLQAGRGLTLLTGLVCLVSTTALAQDPFIRPVNFPDGQERQDIDKLLRNLIESEIKERSAAPVANSYGAYNNYAPMPQIDLQNNELREVRMALENFSREADRLTTSLNLDSRRTPSISKFVGDTLKIRARSSILAQRSGTAQDIRLILPDLQELDQSWRTLAFQLTQIHQQTGGLSGETIRSLQTMNNDIKTLGKVLNLGPQLDRTALLRITASLSSSLRNLMDDIEVELGRTSQTRDLVLEGTRLEQDARYMSTAIVNNRDYKTIVAEYDRFAQAWGAYTTKLYVLENRYIERGIRRVYDVDHELRAALWLPKKLNQAELLQATNILKREVDQFFTRAPLKLLIELPRGQEVIPAAGQFYGVCDNFIDVVNRNEPLEDIVDAYSYIESAWVDFYAIMKPIKSTTAQNVLSAIEKNLIALRNHLGVHADFDYGKAQQLAASLTNMAEHMDMDMQRWLDRSKHPFRNQALRDSQNFVQVTRQFHSDIYSRAPADKLYQTARTLLTEWTRLYGYCTQCETADRDHILQTASEISRTLVDLRGMVGK